MSEEEIIILALATFGAIGFGCSQSPSRVPGLVLRDRITPDAPPAWICDYDRLARHARPQPGQYDNRYYLDDSVLPPITLLSQHSIDTLILILPSRLSTFNDDLIYYLRNLTQPSNLPHVELATPPPAPPQILCLGLAEIAEGLITPTLPEPNPLWKLQSFIRSYAGGFGGYVPSSSSGSSG
jgi:hypothetical protein